MHWPEGFLGKGLCAQSVLIAHHHKLEVESLTDKDEVADGALYKFQFLKRVYLLVGRFLDNRSVTIDKQ
jgi:hypothetical protein